MANRVTVKGRFLCIKNYEKKDAAGNLTGQIVKQVLLFDGNDTVKVADVDGSTMKFGDEVTVTCDLYVNEYGTMFRAIKI